jgi:plasmid stability protein
VPDFLLRDLPEELMTALRQRAKRNARSLQVEMRETLTASVRMPRDEWFAQAAALRARTRPGGETALEAVRAGREERDAAIDRALEGDYDDPGLP